MAPDEMQDRKMIPVQKEIQHKPKIIVAMPAYNEEKYIGTLVLRAKGYADEVIVVDDGSVDNTAEVAHLAGAIVVRHPENRGYGAAIKSLLSEGKAREADVLVLLDADAQHDPSEIPRLIQPLSQGYDVVIGSREMHNGNRAPAYRRLGQKVLLHMTGFLSGEKLTDSESGFRAFSRKALTELKLNENGMAISAETIAAAAQYGLKITEVPISVTYNKDSSTLNPIEHGLSVLMRIIAMIAERKPLFFFGIGGLIVMIAGIIVGFRVVRILSVTGQIAFGSALISTILLIIGIFSIFTGVILFVIAKRNEPKK